MRPEREERARPGTAGAGRGTRGLIAVSRADRGVPAASPRPVLPQNSQTALKAASSVRLAALHCQSRRTGSGRFALRRGI